MVLSYISNFRTTSKLINLKFFSYIAFWFIELYRLLYTQNIFITKNAKYVNTYYWFLKVEIDCILYLIDVLNLFLVRN